MQTTLINETEIIATIDKRILQAKNTKKLMKDISIDMKNKSQYRFKQEKDPNGKKWARNSPVTIARKKSSKPGSDKGHLMGSINAKSNLTQAIAGTNKKYATTVNYGAKKGQYGKTVRNAPIPWGDIPARRFVGFSARQKNTYKKWIKKHLNS